MLESLNYSYDTTGNRISMNRQSVSLPLRNEVSNTNYNEANQMLRYNASSDNIAYDENGNMVSMTNSCGTTTYSLDVRNRLVGISGFNTDCSALSTSFKYDALGRRTEKTINGRTVQYLENHRGQVYTLYKGFYKKAQRGNKGTVVRKVLDKSLSGAISYTYSDTGCSIGTCGGGAADKVIKEVTPLGSIDYTYDAIGLRTSMTVAGQPAVNYSYDANSRLIRISTPNSLLPTPNFDISYDAVGRRTSLTLPNGVKTNYTYDNASHLLEMKHLNPVNQVLESLNYSYDATGNRTSMNRQSVSLPLRGDVTSTSYNEANQMLRYNASSDNIGYDENGNMASVTNTCGTTNYTWDVRNHLVAINGFNTDCSALTASFKYDALGRRIEKTINGKTIQYLYDGLDIVQEIENSVVSANYIRTLNIDEPLARVKSDGTVRYYQTDALGSAVALTDETGTVKTTYSYDPFGNVTISGESSDNPFQYTGRENDETGLYYYRARYYSPELQRFVSEDPIRLRGGINFYAYVGNNSVKFTDPLGLAQCMLLGCKYYQSPWELYSNWQFKDSRVLGPEKLVPWYTVQCLWQRNVDVYMTMTEICTYRCNDDCGRSYTYTTTNLIYKGYIRSYTERGETATNVSLADLHPFNWSDEYCQKYLRPSW